MISLSGLRQISTILYSAFSPLNRITINHLSRNIQFAVERCLFMIIESNKKYVTLVWEDQVIDGSN